MEFAAESMQAGDRVVEVAKRLQQHGPKGKAVLTGFGNSPIVPEVCLIRGLHHTAGNMYMVTFQVTSVGEE